MMSPLLQSFPAEVPNVPVEECLRSWLVGQTRDQRSRHGAEPSTSLPPFSSALICETTDLSSSGEGCGSCEGATVNADCEGEDNRHGGGLGASSSGRKFVSGNWRADATSRERFRFSKDSPQARPDWLAEASAKMERPSPRGDDSPPGLRRGGTEDRRGFGRFWTNRLLQLGSVRSVDSDSYSLPSSNFGNLPIVVSRGLGVKAKKKVERLDSAAFRRKLCESAPWPCAPLPPIDGKFSEKLRRARNIAYLFAFLSLVACSYIGIELHIIHLYGLFQSRGKASGQVSVVGELLPSKLRNIASLSGGLSWVVLFGVLLAVLPSASSIAFIAYSCSKHDDLRRRSDCGAFVASVFLRIAIFGGCLSPVFACLSALNLVYRFSSVRQAEPSSFLEGEMTIDMKSSSSSSFSSGVVKGVASVAVIIGVANHIPLALTLNHFLQLFEGFVAYLRFCEAMDLETAGGDGEQGKAAAPQEASATSLPDVDSPHGQYSLSAAHQGIRESASSSRREGETRGRHRHASTVSNSDADDVGAGETLQSGSPTGVVAVGRERVAPINGKRGSSVVCTPPEYDETSSTQGGGGNGWESGISGPPRALAGVPDRDDSRISGMRRLFFVTADSETKSAHEEEKEGLLESVGRRARELEWPACSRSGETCRIHEEAESALSPPRAVATATVSSSSSSSSPAAAEGAALLPSRQSQRQPSSTGRGHWEVEVEAEEGIGEVLEGEAECEGEESRDEGTEGTVSGVGTLSTTFRRRLDFGSDILSTDDGLYGHCERGSQQHTRRDGAVSTANPSAEAATATAAQEPSAGAPSNRGSHPSPVSSDAEVQSGRPSLSWAASIEDIETFRSAASHQSAGSALQGSRMLGGSVSSSRRPHGPHPTVDRGSGRQAGGVSDDFSSSQGATEVAGLSTRGGNSRDEDGHRDSSGSYSRQRGSRRGL